MQRQQQVPMQASGEYDEEYIQFLVDLLAIAAKYRLKCFIDPHVDCWSRFTGGSGMPGWTLELAGLDMTKFQDTGAAVVHNNASPSDKEDYPHMIWATNSHKLAASTMYTLFFAGQVFAPKALVPLDDITLTYLREIHGAIEAEHEFRQGHKSSQHHHHHRYRSPPVSPTQHLVPVPALLDGSFLERGRINIQHFLQAHYLQSYVHLAKRFREVEDTLHLIARGTVMGFDTMNEPSPGYLNHPDLTKLLDLADLKVGVCPTPFQGMLLAAGNTVVCEDWSTGRIGPLKQGKVKVNVHKTSLWKRPVWAEGARHPSLQDEGNEGGGGGGGEEDALRSRNKNHRHWALRSSVLPTKAVNLLQARQPSTTTETRDRSSSNVGGATTTEGSGSTGNGNSSTGGFGDGWPTPERYSAECLWAQHGVWDTTVGVLIQPHYFERIPRRPTRLGFGEGGTASTTGTMVHRATIPFQYRPGELVEWKADFWLPFVNTMTLLLRQQDTRFIMFVEPPINERPPNFRFHRELIQNVWHGATDWRRLARRLRALVPTAAMSKIISNNSNNSRRKGKALNSNNHIKSSNSRKKNSDDANVNQHTHSVHELQRLDAPPTSPGQRTHGGGGGGRDGQVSLAPLDRLRQQLDQVTVGSGDIRGPTDGDCAAAPLPKQWGWCASSEQHAVFDEHGDVWHNIVAAPHFYDGYTNITRDFVPFTLDYLGYKEGVYSNVLGALHFGWKAIGRVWQDQVAMITRDVHMSIGPHVAVLMGETGLPMDMHDRASFRHGYGDPKQDFAMGLLLRAMDDSRLSYTLWNYCSDNSTRWGDRWNGEDFSVWSEPEHNSLVVDVAQEREEKEGGDDEEQEEGAMDVAATTVVAPSPPRKKTLTELASELPLETTGCSEGLFWWCCVPRGIVWIRQKRALLAEKGVQATTNVNDDGGGGISNGFSVNRLDQSAESSSTIASTATASPSSSSSSPSSSTLQPVKKQPNKPTIKKSIEWQDLLPAAVRLERFRPEYRGLRSAENFVRAYPLATRGEPVFFRFEPGRTVKQHFLDPDSTMVVIAAPTAVIRQSSSTSKGSFLASLGTIPPPPPSSPPMPSFSSPEVVLAIQKAQKQCWETRFSLIVHLSCKAVAELRAKEAKKQKKERQYHQKQKKQQPSQRQGGGVVTSSHERQATTGNSSSSSPSFSSFITSTDIFLPRFHFPLDSSAGLLHFEPLEDDVDPETVKNANDSVDSNNRNKNKNKRPPKTTPVAGRWHQLDICGTDGWWAIDSDRQVLQYWPAAAAAEQDAKTTEHDLNGNVRRRNLSMSTCSFQSTISRTMLSAENGQDHHHSMPLALSPLQQVSEAKDPALSDMERRLVALQAIGWDEEQTPGVTCAKERAWIQQWFRNRKKKSAKKRKGGGGGGERVKAEGGGTAGGTATNAVSAGTTTTAMAYPNPNKGKETVVVASPCSECGQAQVMHLHGLTVAIKIWQGPMPPATDKQKEE
ncbi:hypothetical protein DFQ26_008612 [Actinomortierella ambigua]|nr:hypothetical protein DFQ26_008612 [Actinomortierella ambigua]